MNVYIPKSLSKVDDATKYLLHLICTRIASREEEPDTFVNLKAEYLHAVLRAEYSQIERAIKDGLVECDRQYIVGQKSRGYRLAEKYQRDERVFRQISEPSIIKRYGNHQAERRRCAKASTNGTTYKQCIADLRTVTIDDVDWDEFRPPIKQGSVLTDRERRENAMYKFRRIRKRAWFYRKCKFGRLHTNITQLNNQLICRSRFLAGLTWCFGRGFSRGAIRGG